MNTRFGDTTIQLRQGDITTLAIEAIVNAANPSLMGGGGVDGAIHRAGGPAILEECVGIVRRQGELPTGEVALTTGGELPARYVIHTVGPIWSGGEAGEKGLLESCYRKSLALALGKGITGVAFPAISAGVYGYPFDAACRISLTTTMQFCRENRGLEELIFIYFSESSLLRAVEILEELPSGDSG